MTVPHILKRFAISTQGIVLLAIGMSSGLTVTQPGTDGTSITVDAGGSYSVVTKNPNYTFSGNLAKTLSEITQVTGTNGIGDYLGISFKLQGTGPLQGSILMFPDKVVMFGMKTLASMGTMGVFFPELKTFPANPLMMGNQEKKFYPVVFNTTNCSPQSPLISFDEQANTFILSAADHFNEASMTYSTTSLRSGLMAWATPLPSGWSQLTILAAGKGINKTMDVWGGALMKYYGKTRPNPDSLLELRTLGYWTDNRAAYWYIYETNLGYEGTMLGVKKKMDALNIKLGYIQLDSWWYPKGSTQEWSGGGGVYNYVAHPFIFPKGLKAFTDSLKIPIVTHARWIVAASPLVKYGLSGSLLRTHEGWEAMLGSVHDANSWMFEQDWLDVSAKVADKLGEFDTVFNNMAAVTSERKMSMQYCMAVPKHYLQGAKYSNLGTMRTCDDGFWSTTWGGDRITAHFFATRFIWSLGIYPWTDNYQSFSRLDLTIINAISAGITGPSDFIDTLPRHVPNILASTRRDGILIKPEIPILITDATIIGKAQQRAISMVGRTYSDHGNNYKTFYVFMTAGPYSYNPASDGMKTDNGYYAYNWVNKTGTLVNSGTPLSGTVATGSYSYLYYVLAPVGPSGIAFLGDPSKVVSNGRQRISSIDHSSNQVMVTVEIEPEENSPIALTGYSANNVTAEVSSNGTLTPVNYNTSAKTFSVTVTPKNRQRTEVEKVTVAIGQNPVVSSIKRIIPYRPNSITVVSKNGAVSLNFGNPTDFSVRILSLDGRLCLSENCLNRQSWRSSNTRIKTGTYVIQVKSSSISFVKKIAVQ